MREAYDATLSGLPDIRYIIGELSCAATDSSPVTKVYGIRGSNASTRCNRSWHDQHIEYSLSVGGDAACGNLRAQRADGAPPPPIHLNR